MTAYLAGVALAALDDAQRVLDWHIVSCAVCGTNQPCPERLEADEVFARYQRLPHRTPGLVAAGCDDRPGFGCVKGQDEVLSGGLESSR